MTRRGLVNAVVIAMSHFLRKPLRHGDIHPADVLRDHYGMNAENRPYFQVLPGEVPESLRHLIPYVERWAIHCDVTRGDYFAKQPPEDVADFYYTVLPFVSQIRGWIHTLPKKVADWPNAAVHYLYFLKAHAEAYQPTEEDLRARAERNAIREHQRQLKDALAAADKAFRAGEYQLVANLLGAFHNELDKIWMAKLAFARKKLR